MAGLGNGIMLIGLLAAITIAYFLVGLIISFFVGTVKTFIYAFSILAILSAIIILPGSRPGANLAGGMALFLLFPTVSLTFGLLIRDLMGKFEK